MDQSFLNGYDSDQGRLLPIDREQLLKRFITNDLDFTGHSKNVGKTGDKKNDSDFWIDQQVFKSVGSFVTGPLGDCQSLVINNVNETCWVTFGRHIQKPVTAP